MNGRDFSWPFDSGRLEDESAHLVALGKDRVERRESHPIKKTARFRSALWNTREHLMAASLPPERED